MTNLEINLTPTATLLEIDAVKKIPCRSWGIASESEAAFLLIHGLGGHSGWFEAFARRLKVKHIFVLALDLSGFGKRINENNMNMKSWLNDIKLVFSYLHSVMGDKPVFLLGNSMGGLLALKACPLIRTSGLILLSPAFAGHPKLFPVSYQLSQLFRAVVQPDRQIALPYGSELITKLEQVKVWLDSDPDRRLAVPGKVFIDLFLLTQGLRLQKINLPCPLFLVMAGADGIVDSRISELIFRRINAPNKKKNVMQKSLHDLTLDLAVDQVADLLVDWSNDQTKDKMKSKARQI